MSKERSYSDEEEQLMITLAQAGRAVPQILVALGNQKISRQTVKRCLRRNSIKPVAYRRSVSAEIRYSLNPIKQGVNISIPLYGKDGVEDYKQMPLGEFVKEVSRYNIANELSRTDLAARIGVEKDELRKFLNAVYKEPIATKLVDLMYPNPQLRTTPTPLQPSIETRTYSANPVTPEPTIRNIYRSVRPQGVSLRAIEPQRRINKVEPPKAAPVVVRDGYAPTPGRAVRKSFKRELEKTLT